MQINFKVGLYQWILEKKFKDLKLNRHQVTTTIAEG